MGIGTVPHVEYLFDGHIKLCVQTNYRDIRSLHAAQFHFTLLFIDAFNS